MVLIDKIKEENNPQNTIARHVKEYYQHTGRNCILYYSNFLTSDSEETYIDFSDKLGYMTMTEELDKTKGLDLILHTPGGSVAATESIIDYLHASFGNNIRAVIPEIAMSAGTMIACSSKEILMANHSSLGPVDPQILDFAAKNLKKELNQAKAEMIAEPETIPYWSILLQEYPVNIAVECENLIEWSENILEKSLKYSMFPDSNEEIDKIKKELITGDEIKFHGQNFSIEKCHEIGLNVKNLEKDEKLHKIVLSIHYAIMNYFSLKNSAKIFLNQNETFISYEYVE